MVSLLSGNTYLFYLTLTSCFQVFAFRMNFVDLGTQSDLKNGVIIKRHIMDFMGRRDQCCIIKVIFKCLYLSVHKLWHALMLHWGRWGRTKCCYSEISVWTACIIFGRVDQLYLGQSQSQPNAAKTLSYSLKALPEF